MSIKEKIQKIEKNFKNFSSKEEMYNHIIGLGKTKEPLPLKLRVEENRITGCQSQLYLLASPQDDGSLTFHFFSDALISAGLASLLIDVYNDEQPLSILRHPPLFLKELEIINALSPNRANGLQHLWHRIQKYALDYL